MFINYLAPFLHSFYKSIKHDGKSKLSINIQENAFFFCHVLSSEFSGISILFLVWCKKEKYFGLFELHVEEDRNN